MNSGLAAKDAARWTPGPEGASGVTGRIKSLQALETVFFLETARRFLTGAVKPCFVAVLLCRQDGRSLHGMQRAGWSR